MGYRKIIGFGDSSFVVSLPKAWVVKHNLKKGDVINVEEDSGDLRIGPVVREQSKTVKEININFDGNLKKLNAELAYAYIDNYSLINILGKDLFNHIKGIKETLDNLVALEIMQKTPTKIVLKDCLHIGDISIYDNLRRLDRIVLSMAEDVKNYLIGKDNDVRDSLEHKEKDVTRLSNLLFKVLKRSFNPNDRALLKLELNDLIYYWELVLFVEKVGDQLKRMPKRVKSSVPNEFVIVFDKAMNQYTEAMKSNFTIDYNTAIEVIVQKRNIYDEADSFGTKNHNYGIGMENVKNINSAAGNLAKALLKLKLVKR